MKKVIMFIGGAVLLTSCTISRSIQLTGQPIGTKSGKAQAILTGDSSIKTASENGKITTIGVSETVYKAFIFPITTTKVHGE